MTSSDEDRRDLVRKLVSDTVTSCLKYPLSEKEVMEEDYLYRPVDDGVEDYVNDVRRLLFRPDQDFRLDVNNEFISNSTRERYYQYQLANQMHTCMETCWKYSYSSDGDKKCRFHYPVPPERCSPTLCKIFSLCDGKKRKQTKINAPRNNGWVNPLPVHPLLVFANQGNMDLQYVSNAGGAVEYTCGYISKDDEPDQKMLINIFAKKLAYAIEHSDIGDPTLRQQLTAAGTAIAASQQVGAVQCCYMMLKQDFVKLSRPVYTISSLPTARLTKNIVTDMRQLQHMNPGDSTISTSAKSHAGRCLAYYLLCQQQYKQYQCCHISLNTAIATYTVSKPKKKKTAKGKGAAKAITPALLTVDSNGKSILLTVDRGLSQ